MPNADKLAVLIPTFNGGTLLAESVNSCAKSGMKPDEYEIIVVDNDSTDGSATALPERDAQGARIQVHRNPSDRGRVANWNRAVQIAEEEGFVRVTFLFVGDGWIPNGHLPFLISRMRETNAVLGMAPVRIVNNDGALLRLGKRITVTEPSVITSSDRLLKMVIGCGHIPFAPIQANIYRIDVAHPLRFNPDHAMSADLEATLDFLRDNPGPVLVTAEPFLAWRLHSKRFYASQDATEFAEVNMSVVEQASASTGIRVNWGTANAILFLNAIYGRMCIPMPLTDRWRMFADMVNFIRKRPGGISVISLAKFVTNKLLWNKSYLALP